MNPRLRKIWGDLRESPTRTLLVGLAIAVGTAALAAVFTARTILLREVEASFQSSKPAAVVLTLDAVDDSLIEEAKKRPGVTGAEARRTVRARVEVAPGDWRTLLVFGIRDFRDLRVSALQTAGGDFPPKDGEVLVEQSSLSVLKTATGGKLHVRAPGGKTADLAVAGVVQDAGVAPGWQDNVGYAYASPATLELFEQGSHLDELRIMVGKEVDREQSTQIAADLSVWLKSTGREIRRVEVPLLKHPHADLMNTLLMLLLIFSLLALFLSGALTADGGADGKTNQANRRDESRRREFPPNQNNLPRRRFTRRHRRSRRRTSARRRRRTRICGIRRGTTEYNRHELDGFNLDLLIGRACRHHCSDARRADSDFSPDPKTHAGSIAGCRNRDAGENKPQF